MMELEEAVERILAAVEPLPPERVALEEATNRISAERVASSVDLPPFDNSSVDGYAVHCPDLANADTHPVTLRVIGAAPAGLSSGIRVLPGTCVRIFTGSLLPEGADAVVMQEDVSPAPGEPEKVIFSEKARPWENVRLQGEDVKRGAGIIPTRGMRLTPQRLGLLAAVGAADVLVRPQPKVGLLATGDELREGGRPLAPGQIYESNRVALAGLARQLQCVPKTYPLVPDKLEATKAALEKAFAECDAVVTTGGVSVGELDFVKSAFASVGGELDFWKVAIKPGRPFVFGKWQGKPLFGLPGNPVSAFVTFLVLTAPALLKMSGATTFRPQTFDGTLGEPLANDGARRHFMRVTWSQDGQVRLSGPQASHMLASLAGAWGLVDVPANTTLPEGDSVKVLYW